MPSAPAMNNQMPPLAASSALSHLLLFVLVELLQQALLRQVALHGQRGHAPGAGRRDGLPPLHVVQVARRKHARHARAHAVVHLHVYPCVKLPKSAITHLENSHFPRPLEQPPYALNVSLAAAVPAPHHCKSKN